MPRMRSTRPPPLSPHWTALVPPLRVEGGARRLARPGVSVALFATHPAFALNTVRQLELAANQAGICAAEAVDVVLFGTTHWHMEGDALAAEIDRRIFPDWSGWRKAGKQRVTEFRRELLELAKVPRLTRSDVVVCVDDPLWLCGLLHSVLGRGLVVHFNAALLAELSAVNFEAEEMEVVWAGIRGLVMDPASALGGVNRLIIAQLAYQTGFNAPYVPPVSLYLPHLAGPAARAAGGRPRILVWRTPSVYGRLFTDFLCSLRLPDAQAPALCGGRLHVEHLTERRDFGEIVKFQGVVLLPWEPFMFAVHDILALEQILLLPAEPMIHKMVWSRASGNGGFSYACVDACESGLHEEPQDLRLDAAARAEIAARQRSSLRLADGADGAGAQSAVLEALAQGDEESPFAHMRPGESGRTFQDFEHPHASQRQWLRATDFAEGAVPAVRFASLPELAAKLQAVFLGDGAAAAQTEMLLAMRKHREVSLLSAVGWWAHALSHQLLGVA
eukprot:TRINITY_DN10730_c0_g1_i4.p2 TRINITY_DN10730_c0_g1~~TRINITY_DN10730_c0_g1_i4.p2  ORF type:complete len:503 (+),score=120.03 TRINITY_DN10730_c0_g1_i4:792-2300(+)